MYICVHVPPCAYKMCGHSVGLTTLIYCLVKWLKMLICLCCLNRWVHITYTPTYLHTYTYSMYVYIYLYQFYQASQRSLKQPNCELSNSMKTLRIKAVQLK